MWIRMFVFGLVDDAQAQDELVRRVAQNSAIGDFDGDDLADAVYGDPSSGGTSTCRAGYGSVVVHYGDDPETAVRLARGAGLVGSATCGAAAGTGVAVGDIDGDGYDDLVLGLSGLTWGQVQVVFGSPSGLSATRQTTRTGPSLDGSAAHFGAAIAIGDLNGDGRGDVAVGAPDANNGAVLDVGEVSVYLGQSTGLATTGTRYLQSAFGDPAETGDRFGYALAAGNLDGVSPGQCGFDDLAISAKTEDWAGVIDAGLVHVSYGGTSGVSGGGTDLVTPTGVLGPVREQGLGANLGVGDVDGDGVDDLSMTLTATDQLAWLPGGSTGVGAAVIETAELELEPVCASSAPNGKVEIFFHVGPGSGCTACCGPDDCCIGGSCGG